MNNKAMVKWLVRIGSVTFVAAVIGGISVLESAQKQTDPTQANLSADVSPSSSPKSILPFGKARLPQERWHKWREVYKHDDHDDYDDDNDNGDERDEYGRDHDEDGDDWFWGIVPGNDPQTDTRTRAS